MMYFPTIICFMAARFCLSDFGCRSPPSGVMFSNFLHGMVPCASCEIRVCCHPFITLPLPRDRNIRTAISKLMRETCITAMCVKRSYKSCILISYQVQCSDALARHSNARTLPHSCVVFFERFAVSVAVRGAFWKALFRSVI